MSPLSPLRMLEDISKACDGKPWTAEHLVITTNWRKGPWVKLTSHCSLIVSSVRAKRLEKQVRGTIALDNHLLS